MTQSPATPTAEQLVEGLRRILDVERIEDDYFRGIATPNGRGRSFGGQVIAQALMAATGTVEADRKAHSLHAYFMRPGDATAPVLYRVERDYEGRSFATRRVVAVQNGRPILNLAASFHFDEEGLSHQDEMPDNIPAPEDLESEEQLAERFEGKLPESFLQFLKFNRPIELRPTVLRSPFVTEPQPPQQAVWFRAKGDIGSDPAVHRAALAFASDMGLLGVSMLPHGVGFADKGMQSASLDHAMWIHEDIRMEDWLLYVMDSPWAGGARGFNRGKVFTRDGKLVANVAQEGLVRLREDKS